MSNLLKMSLNFFILIYLLSVSIVAESTTNKPSQNVTSTNSTKAKAIASTNVFKNPGLMAEGGVIVAKTPSLTLTKQDDNISKELIKESSSVTSGPKVVPRKGVGNYSVEENDEIKNSKRPHLQSTTSTPSLPPKSENKTKSEGTHLNIATKSPVYKPHILSYETLANMDNKIKPSTDTKISGENKTPPVKYEYLNKKNSHPELIMPFVITILLIPMFAVVGYLVFRRGQEAWKNRHYKRMDFLLDGMYND